MKNHEASAMVRLEKTTHDRSCNGGLQEMLQMPLDVLFEIFRRLTPGDLLSLSRTSKPFRGLLMTRESSSIWKDSRGNVPDMPDRPAFLSEPAYANLCFGYHCYICRKPKARVFWELGARYCSFCEGKLFHHWRYNVYDDFKSFNEGSLFPIPDEILRNIDGNDITLLHHKITIENLKKRWAGIVTEDQHKEAIAEYRVWQDERVGFAQACKVWISRCKKARKERTLQSERNRMEEVRRRLTELGRGEDLEYGNQYYGEVNDPLWRIPHIKQLDPWAERSWRKLENRIMDVMNRTRTERLFKSAIEPRTQLLKEVLVPWRVSVGIISPHTYSLLFLPEVRSLIEMPPDGNNSATREDFKKLESVFYRYHNEWKQEGLETLAKLVSDSYKLPFSTDLLSLAVSQFFTCSSCYSLLSFPYVLIHNCIRDTRALYTEHKATYEGVIADLTSCSRMPAFKDIVLVEKLRDVIVACGQDPRTVTADEMDALDVRLECISCQVDGVLDAFNWREAWKHYRFTHKFYYNYRNPPAWRQVASTYLPLIKELESNLISNVEQEKRGWFCAHCPRPLDFNLWYLSPKSITLIKIVSHLATVHAIHDPNENDYYSNPWHERSHPVVHYVSLIWQTPVSRQLQYKLNNEEARIIDPFPDMV